MEILDSLFSTFDAIAQNVGAGKKSKTMGDAYLAVCGVPKSGGASQRALRAFALDMHQAVVDFRQPMQMSEAKALQIRIGIHTGEVVAG